MSLDTSDRVRPARRLLDRGWIPRVVTAFGCLSIAVLVGSWIAFADATGVTGILLGTVSTGIPALALVWGGVRLERSDIDAGRYARVLGWCLGGAAGFLGINGLSMVLFPAPTLAGNVGWAHFALNTGAVVGFAVGYVEARSIQREVEAAAATVRAERLEDERELLTYLNDLLRHEVLNSSQIIGGHAALVRTECADPDVRDRLETIEHESADLAAVIEDVRAMLEANREPAPGSVVDLTGIVDEAVADCRTQFDDAVLETELPETAPVRGNEGIRRIVSNLLENAIEHNDGDRPRVRLTVETTPEEATVTIADDGPGIPEDDAETLFERRSNYHGLSLYLVRILASRYDGTVELTDTGPDGSVFVVTLPTASAADG
jgi:signal transduction histidine kinase